MREGGRDEDRQTDTGKREEEWEWKWAGKKQRYDEDRLSERIEIQVI